MRGRWLVTAVAVLAWTVVATVWVMNDPRVSEIAYEPFSTYNTSAGGLSQAFGYLTLRHGAGRVRRLTAAGERALPPHDGILFRIAASSPEPVEFEWEIASRDEQRQRRVKPLFPESEEAWVRAGGRMVLAFSGSWNGLSARLTECSAIRRVFPTAPAVDVEPAPCRTVEGLAVQRFHSLLTTAAEPILLRAASGKGEILVLAIPEIFSNEYLSSAEHLGLLEWLARGRSAIYFDETVHGVAQEASVLQILIRDWHLGPALVALVCAALLHFWRRARRVGPPDRSPRIDRADSVDLIDSAGRLYDKSIDREEALRLYYRALLRTAHVRTGLRGEPLERWVRAQTEGYDPELRGREPSREEFKRMLMILNRAYEMVGNAHAR